jgi:putative NADH-flavin reductase
MEGEREKVLVLGANGKVGKHLVKYLIKNYHVIALIRDAPKYGINSPYLEYATGDAFDSNTLNPLLKSVKIVASCLKPETPHTLLDYVKTLTTSIKENVKNCLI